MSSPANPNLKTLTRQGVCCCDGIIDFIDETDLPSFASVELEPGI